MYSIKTVTEITGLTPETLRAWERRHNVVNPVRDEQGRRVYSLNDVDKLTLLNEARDRGHAIRKIAGLSNSQLKALLMESDDRVLQSIDHINIKLIKALKDYRIDVCEDILRRGLIAMEPLSYAQDFILPLLHRVGELWHKGEISVAQEHIFSNSVKRILLAMVHHRMSLSSQGKKIIFCTLAGESHELGILLASFLAAHHNIVCYYLGADLPAQELISAQSSLQADVIVISLVNTEIQKFAAMELDKLNRKIDERANIWLGGAASKQILASVSNNKRFEIISNLEDYHKRLNLIGG